MAKKPRTAQEMRAAIARCIKTSGYIVKRLLVLNVKELIDISHLRGSGGAELAGLRA